MHRCTALLILVFFGRDAAADDHLLFEDGPRAILAAKCGRCHGGDQLARKAELNVESIAALRRGGESGAVIVPGEIDKSLLWSNIADGLMPPEGEPQLTDDERTMLRNWIVQGAHSRDAAADDSGIPESARSFWSFQPLKKSLPPDSDASTSADSPVDRFLLTALTQAQLSYSPPADRRTLIRRLSLDLLGLPPSPAEVAAFETDPAPDAYQQLVDRLLASPHYGERWGRHWLDVAGYSDSNGYHRADTIRPLAWRYRDYVIAAVNADKPYDRFWMEQLAGDELYRADERDALRTEVAEALIATHFLRNGPDGTDSTEGNEMVQTIERYAVLEQQLQLTISSMFGLTIDCARCHSHKFDPIPQTDYYSLQSLLYPAFNVKDWVTPSKRTLQLATPEQLAHYAAETERIDAAVRELRDGFGRWTRENRPVGNILLADAFADEGLASRWSATAPGDNAPAGSAGVQIEAEQGPTARLRDGALQIVEGGAGSNGWLSTIQIIDWTPDAVGASVQATFDLVADRLTPESGGAERIGFYIAMRDYDDSSGESGGNILCDGNPAGGANVSVDYPGADVQGAGTIGKTGFKPGHNYGVRVTNLGEDRFQLELLVDGIAEEGTATLSPVQLPDGGFGFEFCCGRSFVVDNVSIESFSAGMEPESGAARLAQFKQQVEEKRKEVDAAVKPLDAERPAKPGEIAWITDLSPSPPDVHLLKRGRYFDPGPAVVPAALTVLSDPENSLTVPAAATASGTTGRRRAFAEWATRPGSRAAAMLARVQVNRIWMWHFGKGLVDPPDNFGAQGTLPSHPELLEWLSSEFIASGWSTKHIHRVVLQSAAYQQSTRATPEALAIDPADRLLWSYPPHRLESEAIRDSMIAVSGTLDDSAGGPPAEYKALPNGQIILSEETSATTGPHRRTIYYRHRRSEPVTFLQTFDQPAAEPNCLRRATSAVVSQTLAMLNGEFSIRMAQQLAGRVRESAGDDPAAQVDLAFRLTVCRPPSNSEAQRAADFVRAQTAALQQAGDTSASQKALSDFCQVLLASSEFIYIQ